MNAVGRTYNKRDHISTSCSCSKRASAKCFYKPEVGSGFEAEHLSAEAESKKSLQLIDLNIETFDIASHVLRVQNSTSASIPKLAAGSLIVMISDSRSAVFAKP
ncbi:hypothetical protein NPIL_552481 [Nephila pilipes]|uniref:Uncharacterized protein n=1 Tax=Nephila pilipes TaxID=299642 RepID=A0A8X6MPB1_NEPPI|nr:hypothetical protein NPIL_552481 [Nephila pilipes]